MCAKTIRDLRIWGFNAGSWWPRAPGLSMALLSLSLKFLLLMGFPFSVLHFMVDDPLLFRVTRSRKSSKCSRASWLEELLSTDSITDMGHTRTPTILSHQALAHLHPPRRVQDFSGLDSKAIFGSYFTGHRKTWEQYLELYFKTSQHGVVQENQSLLQITVSYHFSTSPNPNLEPAELLQLNIKAEVITKLNCTALSD